MGATDTFQLPYPEYPDPAAAPDAFKALADGTEKNLPKLRAWQSSRILINDVGVTAAIGATAIPLTDQTITLTAFGLAVIHLDMNVFIEITWPNMYLAAGFVNLVVNGTVVQSFRLHNYSKTAVIPVDINYVMDLPKTLTSLVISATMTNDGGSQGIIRALNGNFSVAQIGAPRA